MVDSAAVTVQQHTRSSRLQALWALLLLMGVPGGMAVLFFFNPEGGSSFYPPCIFHSLTGLHCPGCGSTRCLYRVVHLDFFGAWRCNPFTVLALPYLGAHFFVFQVRAWTGRRLSLPFAKPRFIWLILFAIMFFWIARNIPVAPFTFLAPNGGG